MDYPEALKQAPCEVGGCGREVYARALCHMHYQRLMRRGDEGQAGPIHPSGPDAFEHLATPVGDCLIWFGPMNQYGYGRITVQGVRKSAHRYAWELRYGEIPKGRELDHICYNPACVKVDHLRLAARAENARNRSSALSLSGVRGVTITPFGTYQVRVKKNRKTHHFGTYKTLAEAAKVARNKRLELFGAFAGRG